MQFICIYAEVIECIGTIFCGTLYRQCILNGFLVVRQDMVASLTQKKIFSAKLSHYTSGLMYIHSGFNTAENDSKKLFVVFTKKAFIVLSEWFSSWIRCLYIHFLVG